MMKLIFYGTYQNKRKHPGVFVGDKMKIKDCLVIERDGLLSSETNVEFCDA